MLLGVSIPSKEKEFVALYLNEGLKHRTGDKVRGDIREVTGSRYRGKHKKDGGQASIRRRVESDAAAELGRWSKDTAQDE